jgi:hypothetical protein
LSPPLLFSPVVSEGALGKSARFSIGLRNEAGAVTSLGREQAEATFADDNRAEELLMLYDEMTDLNVTCDVDATVWMLHAVPIKRTVSQFVDRGPPSSPETQHARPEDTAPNKHTTCSFISGRTSGLRHRRPLQTLQRHVPQQN